MKCICCDICKEYICVDGKPFRDYYIIKERSFPKIIHAGRTDNYIYNTKKLIMCEECMLKFKKYIVNTNNMEDTE